MSMRRVEFKGIQHCLIFFSYFIFGCVSGVATTRTPWNTDDSSPIMLMVWQSPSLLIYIQSRNHMWCDFYRSSKKRQRTTCWITPMHLKPGTHIRICNILKDLMWQMFKYQKSGIEEFWSYCVCVLLRCQHRTARRKILFHHWSRIQSSNGGRTSHIIIAWSHKH